MNATVVWELYEGTSAFSKRLLLSHTCSQDLFVFNMSVHLARHRNTKTGIVELSADGAFSNFLKGTSLSGGRANINAASYQPVAQSFVLDSRFGPGLSHWRAGQQFTSFTGLQNLGAGNGF